MENNIFKKILNLNKKEIENEFQSSKITLNYTDILQLKNILDCLNQTQYLLNITKEICNKELLDNKCVYWNPSEEKYEAPRRDLAILILDKLGAQYD